MPAKVLSGVHPADIPVERPDRYEVALNLKTAKALGVTIPQPLLLRAERVFEGSAAVRKRAAGE